MAFAPVDNVEVMFENLMQSEFYLEHEEVLKSLVDYFENTWIGAIRSRSNPVRKPVHFGIPVWNFCYDACLNNLPKTNNSIEGWNYKFSRLLGANHPTVWKFIVRLKQEQGNIEFNLAQYIAGSVPAPSKRKCKIGDPPQATCQRFS